MATDTAAGLQIDEITTPRALEALRPEWARLWRRCADATPFQSPEWMLAWWRRFGYSPLWALAVRLNGRLVGLAPFFIWTDENNVRRVLLIGTGISDRLDLLVDPEHDQPVLESIVLHLSDHRDRWDVCDFQQLPARSPLLEVPLPAELSGECTPQDVCPVLPLPRRVDDLSESVPAGHLKKLGYYRRRAQRDGPVRIDRADAENFDELFDAFLRLHQARWSVRGLSGMLADDLVQKVHREAAVGLLEAGLLRLYGLKIGGRTVASFYGFSDGRRTCYYLGGFDPELKHLKPGRLIIGHAIEEAVRGGCHTFDFLRGREEYKYEWGARDEQNYRRRLYHE